MSQQGCDMVAYSLFAVSEHNTSCEGAIHFFNKFLIFFFEWISYSRKIDAYK